MTDYEDMVLSLSKGPRGYRAYKDPDVGYTIEVEHWMGGTEFKYFDENQNYEPEQDQLLPYLKFNK